MEFRTVVDIEEPGFRIGPCEQVLFVGSCFADNIGRRFRDEQFRVTVNPYGVMYNPASILHTLERMASDASLPTFSHAFLTLGTNHVYRLKETGEIVDNCQKRPASLFQEEELSVEACADYLIRAVNLLLSQNPSMHIVLTVSPIRYRKYGYHRSQLSKATLLLAIDRILQADHTARLTYFPAYEILNDELRDYRFYAPDMLHPSEQAVDYLWERLVESYFSAEAKTFLEEWSPLKQALAHRPLHPDSSEYLHFRQQTRQRLQALKEKYPAMDIKIE